jgi:hypothetical protein
MSRNELNLQMQRMSWGLIYAVYKGAYLVILGLNKKLYWFLYF